MASHAPAATAAVSAQATSRWASGPALVAYISAALLALHLLTASRYGYFGDEMYHVACGEHLAWGYVDQPPLIALVAWLVRHTLGTSLLAIRFVPALAGAATVLLTGALARQLGGGRFAQALAALCIACASVYLVLNYLFTMNAWEPLLWTGCAYIVVRIIKTGDQKLWLWFGLLSGVGLENKYSMAVFGFGIVVGLLLTPERKALASKWIWLAGGLALAIFLPNLLWNIRYHFPFLELLHNIRASGRDVVLGPAQYLLQQILIMNPLTFPVWLAGIVYLFFSRNGRSYRLLGWSFLAVFLTFFLQHGKDYYTSPVYPIVFTAGAVALEQITQNWSGAWLRGIFVTLLLAGTAAMLPLNLPVLSPERLVRYVEKFPLKPQASERAHARAELPHYFAWQFGWPEMVEEVARVYHSLPPDEQAKTAIIGNNFAESGAVDLLGPKYGLPKSIGVHQSYWLWGPRNYTGEIMIVLGDEPEDLGRWCNTVDIIAEPPNIPYMAVFERHPVLLCRGLRGNLQQLWPKLKDWD
ncbi:MAG TPA: glycosyltransferase family 39 protein [Terriglobales bacterium]|nr:glycosyltransferase family 39 protein [Terriglobales bacterium]